VKTERISLRVDVDLKHRVQRLAKKRGVTFTRVVEELLREWVESDLEVEQA
jgi:predicted transcriptional regulator